MIRLRHVLLFPLLLVYAPSLFAFDSKCYVPAANALQECKSGPEATRHQWRGPLAEHADIFEQAAALAGWPDTALDLLNVDVFTSDATVDIRGNPSPTYIPADFSAIARVVPRTQGIADFSQLPDFSFSLFDWALGNETCPLDEISPNPIDSETCHAFKRHMGAANSNHFLPQAQHFYTYYHDLAVERAELCKRLQVILPANTDRFNQYRLSCEKLAFVLESIAHHFLQDAWSSGHMWERWGSPDPRDYDDLATGLSVALTTGIIHGVRGVVTALEDTFLIPIREVNDTMCAPHPEVEWRDTAGLASRGVGDLYSNILLSDPIYAKQRSSLLSCSVVSMRELYQAFGPTPAHGALVSTPFLENNFSLVESLDPAGNQCFGQRSTNRAIRRGAGVDFVDALGFQRYIPLREIAPNLVPIASAYFGGVGDPINFAGLQARYRRDVLRIAANISDAGDRRPFDTDLASGISMGSLLGIGPNSDYVKPDQLAPYIDPPLPWLPQSGPAVSAKDSALAFTFHEANAEELCDRFQDNDPEFNLSILRDRIADIDQDSEERTALCSACGVFASRHVRYGTDPNNYFSDHQPLCHYLTDAETQFIYVNTTPTTSASDAARSWCGCDLEEDSTTVVVAPSPAVTNVERYSSTVTRTSADVNVDGTRECDVLQGENTSEVGSWSYSAMSTCQSQLDSGQTVELSATAEQNSQLRTRETTPGLSSLLEAQGSGITQANRSDWSARGTYIQSANNQFSLDFTVGGTPVTLNYSISLLRNIHTVGYTQARLLRNDTEVVFNGRLSEFFFGPIDTTNSIVLDPGTYRFDVQSVARGGQGFQWEFTFELQE